MQASVLLCSIPVLLGRLENGAKVPSPIRQEVPQCQWLTKLETEMTKSQGPENIGPENAVLSL
jgi:hypothetical protein